MSAYGRAVAAAYALSVPSAGLAPLLQAIEDLRDQAVDEGAFHRALAAKFTNKRMQGRVMGAFREARAATQSGDGAAPFPQREGQTRQAKRQVLQNPVDSASGRGIVGRTESNGSGDAPGEATCDTPETAPRA